MKEIVSVVIGILTGFILAINGIYYSEILYWEISIPIILLANATAYMIETK